MKNILLRLEFILASSVPIRWAVIVSECVLFRLGWLCGRLRLAAKVRNRGLGCVCHWSSELKYPENISLGKRVVIGVNVTLGAHSAISLGDDVRLSKDVVIETAGLDFSAGAPPYRHVSAPITLEEGAWIGMRSIILGGVTIGRHAVVAAGSVVTRDVPSGTVVAGNPARPLRSFQPQASNE